MENLTQEKKIIFSIIFLYILSLFISKFGISLFGVILTIYSIYYLFKNNKYNLDEEENEYVDNLKVKTYKKASFDCLLLEKTYSSNVYFYNYYELYKNKEDDITFYQTEIITSNDLFKIKDEKLVNEFLKTAKVSFRSYYLDGFMGYCSIEDSKNENM